MEAPWLAKATIFFPITIGSSISYTPRGGKAVHYCMGITSDTDTVASVVGKDDASNTAANVSLKAGVWYPYALKMVASVSPSANLTGTL